MLNSFLKKENNTVQDLMNQLNTLSKRELYRRVFFYKLNSFISSDNVIQKSSSFEKLLWQNYFLYKDINLGLVRGRIITINSSFLYFDSGKKCTVLKPKFKVFFPSVLNLVQKEILFSARQFFLSFLKLKDLNRMLQIFQFFYVRENFYLTNLQFSFLSRFCFKKFICCNKYFKEFFFTEWLKLFILIFKND